MIDPDAFKVLVDRHGNAVYAQCRRELRDPHLAEDVTQAVFMVLHRKASSLPANVILPAWLFKVTRYACANARRAEARRERHEKEAAMMRELQHHDATEAPVSDLESVLDSSLERLGRADREAIVLRYYSGLNTAEVGQQLGISPETAKKRISRAVTKLRDMLGRKGVNTTSALLLIRLDSLAVPSAPVNLAQNIISKTFNPSAANSLSDSIVQGVIQMMRWTQIKLAFTAALVVIILGAGGMMLRGARAQTPPPPPAADPVAQDQVDRVMIRTSLQNLAQAIRTNDLTMVNQCITAPTNDDSALAKAMLMQNVAYRHLQNAWAAKLKQPVKFNGLSFVMLSPVDGGVEVVLEQALANIADSDIQITGTTARVPLKFGALGKAMQLAGLNLQGFWVPMVNDGVGWKIDVAKTVHIQVLLVYAKNKLPASSDEDVRIALDQKRGVNETLEATAQAIDSGAITTAADAAKKVETEVRAVHAKLGIVRINFDSSPALPVSYEVGN